MSEHRAINYMSDKNRYIIPHKNVMMTEKYISFLSFKSWHYFCGNNTMKGGHKMKNIHFVILRVTLSERD